jgi:hypothetical protein
MGKNTVTQEQVNGILKNSTIEFENFGEKTVVAKCVLPNGFVIVEYASCVDPAHFDEKIGKDICLERISNKVWELEGYSLQNFLFKAKRALENQNKG